MPQQVRSLAAMIARIAEEDDPPEIVITGPARAEAERRGLHTADLSGLSRPAAQVFLNRWRPDLVLWGSANLSHTGLIEAQKQAISSILLDVGRGGRLPSGGWRPGRLRQRLCGFNRIMTVSDLMRMRLIRMGADGERIETLGKFDDAAPPPACDPGELAQMAQAIGPRPLWLAAEVPGAEISAVLSAHRQASRQSHRLLLVLAPESPDDPVVEHALAQSPSRVARRDSGEDPGELHQVLLADVCGELGLWLRLAPVTYMGGSLSGGGSLSPLAAAALGSAVIHGLHGRPELKDDFSALSRIGASLPIANESALPGALQQLLAPDITAKLASAAWSVTSAGAPALNRIIDMVQNVRDGIPI